METANPLEWPVGRPRSKTRTAGRTKVSLATARDELLAQLKRLDMINVVISSNAVLLKNGRPASRQPKTSDPGVAVWFSTRHALQQRVCLSCDQFDTIAANLRSIGMGLDEMVSMCMHLTFPIKPDL